MAEQNTAIVEVESVELKKNYAGVIYTVLELNQPIGVVGPAVRIDYAGNSPRLILEFATDVREFEPGDRLILRIEKAPPATDAEIKADEIPF